MRQKALFFSALISIGIIAGCNKPETGIQILEEVISCIDTVQTVSYKQDMARTNPRDFNDTIFRHRKMIFQRLEADSIVGVKGHWYMYMDDSNFAMYEDICDGERLIRKNNDLVVARLYDLKKHPEFKEKHFWSHNTPFAMQYEFKFMLENPEIYTIERLSDTSINNKNCYLVSVTMKDYSSMPGFEINPVSDPGSQSVSYYFIDKETHYPIRFKSAFSHVDDPEQTSFMIQDYYDLKFNEEIDEAREFNTSEEWLAGYEIIDMKPE